MKLIGTIFLTRSNQLSTILITLVLFIVSFINSQSLSNNTLLSYYLFVLITCIFTLYFLRLLLIGKIKIIFGVLPVLSISWAIYVVVRSFFSGIHALNEQALYIVCFVALVNIFSTILYYNTFKKWIYKIVLNIAIIESVLCIAQLFGIIESKNVWFKITGSVINPNITAMFLAMMCPLLLFYSSNSIISCKRFSFNVWNGSKIPHKHILIFFYKIFKSRFVLIYLLIFCSLILLNCRTAYIGASVSLVVYIYWKFENFFDRLNKFILIISLTFFLMLAGIGLYFLKPNSAQGRVLIWKISARMIVDRPVWGYGYNMFERNYNLYQSEFFKSKSTISSEDWLMRHVNYAYNEYLNNAVEGGLIGCCFFLTILGMALYYSLKIIYKRQIKSPELLVAASGIISFAVMSLVNYTMPAIPVMILFSIYLARLSSHFYAKNICSSYSNYFHRIMIFKLKFSIIKKMFFLAFSLAIFWLFINRSKMLINQYELQQAVDLEKMGKPNDALFILKKIEPYMKNNPVFLQTYGDILKNDSLYLKSLYYLKQVSLFNTDVSNNLSIGQIYEQLNNFQLAESYYLYAIYQVPILYNPRIRLLKLYQKTGESVKARNIAKSIINMPVKIQSYYIYHARWEAEEYLNQTKY